MVWTQYAMCSAESQIRAAAYTTFVKYWHELAPHILVMKPMTDLCWICQKNSAAIMKAKNTSDELKSEVSWLKNHTLKAAKQSLTLRAVEQHIELAKPERAYYKKVCKDSTSALKSCFTADGNFLPPPPGSCCPLQNEMTVHYSFDFAHQVNVN